MTCFPAYGVRFIAINDALDTANDGSGDDLTVSVKNIMNEAYCRDISIKTRSALDIKRRNGDFVGAFTVYGYLKSEDNRNQLTIDPYAANIVRTIFRMRLEGSSANNIANELNRMCVLSPLAYKKNKGLPYAKGGYADKEECRWSATTIIRIIDNGFSGKRFDRPAFQEMLQDIEKSKIGCVVVKDLSRLGRDYITVGYYLEMFFPSNNVRFVSINDQFDTTDGITNRDKSAYIQSRTRIPLINLFNEQVSIETKMKVEVVLDMKAQHGEFIGPRAPFGYQKSNENPSQLVPDPAAAVIVRKIFEMAASGTGVTGIVRYLNERSLPTPIQYARAHGLDGNFDDGNGSWNSRSVKYILTNRTYTGMLVQGKEKRAVEATHELLVDSDTFDAIQKAFQARTYNVVPQGQSANNILRGKVICGCCGGKMQRKRGTNHADWYFFTCITKNRLGVDKCTGMYTREEDVLNAIYRQLKDYVNEHYITNSAYKQQLQEYTEQIADLAQRKTTAWINAMEHYEQYVQGEISKEEFRAVQDIANQAKEILIQATKGKDAYEKQYAKFRKLLSASSRDIPLSKIVDCIDKVVVDSGGKIVVEWHM